MADPEAYMADPEEHATINSLGEALLQKVLKNLEPEEQGRAATVSHAFREAAVPLAPALRHYSSQGNARAVLRLLLKGGTSAGLGARPPAVLETALYLAADGGHTEVVSILMMAGMRPDEAAEDGSLPLVRAAFRWWTGCGRRWSSIDGRCA